MYQILIADDEKGYCDLLEKSINRMEGFHVVGKAYDGERAAQLAEELHPDILITDINMSMCLRYITIARNRFCGASILMGSAWHCQTKRQSPRPLLRDRLPICTISAPQHRSR